MTPIKDLRHIMHENFADNESEISDNGILTDSASRSESDQTSNSDVPESKDNNSNLWTNKNNPICYEIDIKSLHGKFFVESLTDLKEQQYVDFLLRNIYLVEQMLESENPEIILMLRNESKSLMSPKNNYKTYAVLVIELLKKQDPKVEEDLYNFRTLWKRTNQWVAFSKAHIIMLIILISIGSVVYKECVFNSAASDDERIRYLAESCIFKRMIWDLFPHLSIDGRTASICWRPDFAPGYLIRHWACLTASQCLDVVYEENSPLAWPKEAVGLVGIFSRFSTYLISR